MLRLLPQVYSAASPGEPYGAVTNDRSGDVVPRYVLPFLKYYEMLAYAG